MAKRSDWGWSAAKADSYLRGGKGCVSCAEAYASTEVDGDPLCADCA
ncbi:hypothetical protein [Actinocorallia aurantiaca]|uniref:Uncharacterized protein n=1 Tax=Actinocorallia aurantiaca TaxID=46204 RepID=A0ABP6GPS0_9ACTN